MDSVLVAGGGVFGITAAIELRKRGHAVRLLDPGPLPHPLAASTDISKVVRLEYGPDADWTSGTFNPVGGFVESGNVIARLAVEARRLGVEIVEGRFAGPPYDADQV